MADAGAVAKTSLSKLEALRKKEAELKARIAEAEAAEKAKHRKLDTRVKVLIGAAFLADCKEHPETRELIAAVLNRSLAMPKDREFLRAGGWL